jgi:hypothetical protein
MKLAKEFDQKKHHAEHHGVEQNQQPQILVARL